MIGRLRGTVAQIGDGQALLDVQGVGYLVFCSTHTLANLQLEAAASLIIQTHVREDHIHLYGFETDEEKAWFETLLSVQGVGPKMALAILSTLRPDALANALMLEDKRPFQSVSGVGPKLATRLVTELKQKAPALDTTPAASGARNGAPAGPSSELSGSAAVLRDVISALSNLGYDESAARAAAQTALAEAEGADLEALIPRALRALSR